MPAFPMLVLVAEVIACGAIYAAPLYPEGRWGGIAVALLGGGIALAVYGLR